MDWKGQMHAEWIYQLIITLFSLVGFVYAYQEQDFTHCFHGWLAGLVLASALTIPDLPWFNKNPIKWLDECPAQWSTREYEDDGVPVAAFAPSSGGNAKRKHKKKKGKSQ